MAVIFDRYRPKLNSSYNVQCHNMIFSPNIFNSLQDKTCGRTDIHAIPVVCL